MTREVADAVRALSAEARDTDERRLLVLAGGRETTRDLAGVLLDVAGIDGGGTVALSGRRVEGLDATHLPLDRSGELLGTTRDAVVLDCHDETRPNALGRAVGAVDGGGLLVLVVPPLDRWPDRRDGFDDGLAVPPFGVDAVTGRFRRRLVRTLREHRGIAVVDADRGTVERDGLTDPAPRRRNSPCLGPPADAAFPPAAYEACLTGDQHGALAALEALRDPGAAVVVSADRGRGKSSAAGLAAGALAAEGQDVLVTTPGYRNAAEVFDRARELLDALGVLAEHDEDRHVLSAAGGGRVRFRRPTAATDLPEEPDAVIVDEAAALPVRLLEGFLDADAALAFATTVHGYEGAGRGFDVRFRDRLAASDRDVVDATMTDPIRYAAGDPVETWAFRALLLDARPAVDKLVAGATPADCEYAALEAETLLEDEHRLREAFGLLVLAHYRTEPDDLARLLDAPNVAVRALTYEDRIVCVALLAREGGLSAERRRRMYEGERVRGNMLPDVLTSQLRDEAAGAPVGLRVLRIATHPAVRSRGLGSRLLGEVVAEARAEGFDWPGGIGPGVDYLGVGYGATPRLLRFWADNGFGTLHLSTTRNEASGEYSALMARPLTDAGRDLHDRTAAWFRRRVGSVLADALDDADPDVVRETLAATARSKTSTVRSQSSTASQMASTAGSEGPTAPEPGGDPDLTDREWRTVAAGAFGPGLYDAAPRPFRELALRHLIGRAVDVDGDDERLLVRKVLQARSWDRVAEAGPYVSRREAMRSLGDAYRPLVEHYGTDAALEEADRYR
ncbi:tRNA(Met) cytidine acetyltransferase [Halobacteriales archaeon QS_5_70_15]|nr:MAG: tRNA(Met) cytidine acetyltransferase [Halobacteriales archaeon QS_5_70_15]